MEYNWVTVYLHMSYFSLYTGTSYETKEYQMNIYFYGVFEIMKIKNSLEEILS